MRTALGRGGHQTGTGNFVLLMERLRGWRLPVTRRRLSVNCCRLATNRWWLQGGSCQVKLAVVNFAAGNFAEAAGFCVVNLVDTPTEMLWCRALQARRSLGTGANFAEDPFLWEILWPT